MSLSSKFNRCADEELAVLEHSPQDVDAASGQCDDGLVMPLPFLAFAGMEVAQARSPGNSVEERTELLRPTLERAAIEARELELDPETVLALFSTILKAKR